VYQIVTNAVLDQETFVHKIAITRKYLIIVVKNVLTFCLMTSACKLGTQ